MRRYVLVWIVATMMLASAGAGVSVLAEATPAPETNATPVPGERAVVLAETYPDGIQQRLMLVRIELAPGDGGGLNDLTGTRIVYVESGTLSYRLDSGEATVSRGAGESNGEDVPADAWIELAAGDRVVESTGAVHEYVNEGDQPVVILMSGLFLSELRVRCASSCFGN